MNLHIQDVITIKDSQITVDYRQGVNNAIIEGDHIVKNTCCIFTQPDGENTVLRIEVLESEMNCTMITMTPNQLQHLADLISPYLKR